MPVTLNQTFAKRLREERQRWGQSQERAAHLAGVSRQSWCRYEAGELVPGGETLAYIGQQFAVSTDYLLGLSDKKYIAGVK